MRPAVFLDRDGTLIREVGYLTDPAAVALLPGAARALRRLRERGYACVLVTNQSAIGRGLLDDAGLAAVHLELRRQLDAGGTELDGIYSCPHAPAQDDPGIVEHPDRKPGPGMLLRAARDHDLDLRRSYMVGDQLRDLLAGRNAGCRAVVLVRSGQGERFAGRGDCYDHCADDLEAASEWILGQPGTEEGSDRA